MRSQVGAGLVVVRRVVVRRGVAVGLEAIPWARLEGRRAMAAAETKRVAARAGLERQSSLAP